MGGIESNNKFLILQKIDRMDGWMDGGGRVNYCL